MEFPKGPNILGLLLVLTIVVSSATAAGPVCPPTETFIRKSFPKGFLFGTATSAYQVEGAVDEGGRGSSLWDTYCKNQPARCNNDNGDVAVDFYHRYKEDIQLMKRLNSDAFRFSIAWPRIFPHGRMSRGISKAGVQFYHDLIDELLQNGITPLVTVFHWDTPQDLEDEYDGFLSSNIVKDFREYSEFVFNQYGDKVKHWITFNEPWLFSHAGYDTGKKAPGRCSRYVNQLCQDGRSGFEAYQVSHNLLISHAEAVEAFRSCERVERLGSHIVQLGPRLMTLQTHKTELRLTVPLILFWGGNLCHVRLCVAEFGNGRWTMGMSDGHLDTTTFGDYPQAIKDIVGHRLPKFTDEQKRKLTNSTDFVGINYYSSYFSSHKEKIDPSKPSWQQDSLSEFDPRSFQGYRIGYKPWTRAMFVYDKGLRRLLKYIKDKYNNPEIIIAGNGYDEELKDKDSVEVGTADYHRKFYLQRHLLSLYEAICEDGVNVTGYFIWSLLDNFDWQNGYKNRVGLYYIDFKNNLTRHEKESAKWYSMFLKRDTDTSKIHDEF